MGYYFILVLVTTCIGQATSYFHHRVENEENNPYNIYAKGDVSNSNRGRFFIWKSNKAGLYSQFLQVKLLASYAHYRFRRAVIVPPIASTHFMISAMELCNIFEMPSKGVACDLPIIAQEKLIAECPAFKCQTTANPVLFKSDQPIVCYNGSIFDVRVFKKNLTGRDLMLRGILPNRSVLFNTVTIFTTTNNITTTTSNTTTITTKTTSHTTQFNTVA